MQLPTSSSNAEKQPGVSSSPDDKPGMASYFFVRLSIDSKKISKFIKCPMRTESNDFFVLNCHILKTDEMM